MKVILDDSELLYMVVNIVCGKCRHYLKQHNCKAFPSGMPDDILKGKNDHKEPHEGDHGIQFKPIE